MMALSRRRKYRIPGTLSRVLDFGFLKPETKGRGGKRSPPPPRTLLSSCDPPSLWDASVIFLSPGMDFFLLLIFFAILCIF